VTKVHEFYLGIKPTKLIKGQGLAKLLAKENCRVLGLNFMDDNLEGKILELVDDMIVDSKLVECSWYKDFYFLKYFKLPPEYDKSKVRSFKLKTIKYYIKDNCLYWKDPTGVLLRCIDPEESKIVIFQMHSSVCGGHHYWRTTAYKILRASYFWPNLFFDVYDKVRTCKKCQRFTGKKNLKSLPLKSIIVSAPFQQQVLDFIGEIRPLSIGKHHWILVATDYFTKWIEAIPTRNATHKVIINFLEGIITRFGCPSRLLADNAVSFKATPLVNFYEDYGIQLTHSNLLILQLTVHKGMF